MGTILRFLLALVVIAVGLVAAVGTIGLAIAILGFALKVALLGGAAYLAIRIFSPDTATRLRERWSGYLSGPRDY
jgi:hypothetical protein